MISTLTTDRELQYVIPTADLVPSVWMPLQPSAGFFVFNPAIVRYGDRLLMTYRVDFGRGPAAQQRTACAICVLDERLQVASGSVVALSDTIVDGGANHYDPRFLVVGDRLFVHFNNNWDTQPNHIFLVEIDPDTLTAKAPARPLCLEGPRQTIEKNWMLFEHDGELFAIYQVAPHIILRVDLAGAGPVRCWPVYRTEWDTTIYTRRYGALRGGAPPMRVGDSYVAIFHSRTLPRRMAPANPSPAVARLKRASWVTTIKRWLREWLDPLRYYGGVYGFAAAPPFAPTFIRPEPLLHPAREERRRQPTAAHLTPRRVVYPCGLVRLADDRWLVSYGVHDERAVLRVFTRHEIEGWAGMEPQELAP